ncbi:uncharacterized protein LOC111061693 [Nilaparvata lugens]|uniref:uncharacterized protein LOC111061693 n=1 Tax=Nilaparvata lugens TaxID=108931 RepID=UPI00193EAE91|nr:uncharacterized protein LOC111061693 [Nilaparvata lugens]
MESTTVLHFLGWILIIWNICSFEVSAVKQKKQTGVTGDQLLIGSLQPIPTIYKTLPSIAYYGILCTPGKYQDNFTLEIYKNSEGVTNKLNYQIIFWKSTEVFGCVNQQGCLTQPMNFCQLIQF